MYMEHVEIEGLDSFNDHDLSEQNDTPPGGVQIHFDVVSEYMPFLSEQANREIRKNFVYCYYNMELGRSAGRCRINDEVVFDEATQKWKVVRLATGGNSHIKRWPQQWNAFHRGISYQEIGTPIDLLFKGDPSRSEIYKTYKIHTIEQLAGLNESDAGAIGMGSKDDRRKAIKFIERANEGVNGVKVNTKIRDLESENSTLKSQITDLANKLTKLLELQNKADEEKTNAKRGPGRPKKIVEEEEEPMPEGIEGV